MPRAEPLQLKAAACQTFAGNIPGKPWRPIARTSNNWRASEASEPLSYHVN